MSVISYLKETVSKIKFYTDIFMRMEGVTHYLFLAFKLSLVYFQHTFHCLINEAAYLTNLVLLTICLINNTLYGDVLFRRKHFPKNGENQV